MTLGKQAVDGFPETFEIVVIGLALRSANDDTVDMENTATNNETRNETMATQRATHAEFIGTECIPGYRVTIYTGSKVVASQFFKAEGGYEKYREKCEACYAEAKRYAAGFGCS